MPVDALSALANSGSTEQVELRKGIKLGVKESDPFASRGPMRFTVTSMSANMYSWTAQSFIANGASPTEVRDTMTQLIKELIRKGVLDGSYSL